MARSKRTNNKPKDGKKVVKPEKRTAKRSQFFKLIKLTSNKKLQQNESSSTNEQIEDKENIISPKDNDLVVEDKENIISPQEDKEINDKEVNDLEGDMISPTVYNDLLTRLDLALTQFECIYYAAPVSSDSAHIFRIHYPQSVNLSIFHGMQDPLDPKNNATRLTTNQKVDSFIYGDSKYLRKRKDIGDHLQIVAEKYPIPGYLVTETENYTIMAHTIHLGGKIIPRLCFDIEIDYRIAVVDKRTREVKTKKGCQFINIVGGDNLSPFMGPYWSYNGLFDKTKPIVIDDVEIYPGGEDVVKVMMCAALVDKVPCKLKNKLMSKETMMPVYYPFSSIDGSEYFR